MKLFKNVGGAKVGRSVFNLSYEKKLTCDMGLLIPIMCDEMVPGDVWSIGNEVMVRFNPMVAPIMHEVNVFTHYFFVPNRLLWDDWEDFITGGESGTEAPSIPTWSVTDHSIGSLWDHLGMPTVVSLNGIRPVDFPKRAYNMIYNDFYRDENLITEINITTAEAIQKRAWEKDYFTSALPWQQRGTAPSLPISGTITVDSDNTLVTAHNSVDATARTVRIMSDSDIKTQTSPSGDGGLSWDNTGMEVDLSTGTTFDVADIRLAFQIQKWQERNARAGARYTEFLKSHFNVSPRDDRLDRPEFIGGSRSPVIVSEVLQTSETGATAQGEMAGHAISVDRRFITKYRCKEFGIIMGIMSIMPKPAYSQGVDRQWTRRTNKDYYFPEFANLSEQQIIRAEIYGNSVQVDNLTVFGYQGKYDEMRIKRNMLAGTMRSTFDHWHLARKFASPPTLNQTFIECVPRKDIFAAPSEDACIVNFGNVIKAVRPMPIMSNPGLIDHV